MYKHLAANAFTLLIVAVFAVGVVILWGRGEFTAPGPLPETTIVTVEPGDRLDTVTKRLVDAGAITNPTVFRLAARYTGGDRGLKFGDYEVPQGASMEAILDLITSGRSVNYNVTVVEGWTSWQVVQRLNALDTLKGEVTVIPPEGSLAPDTYSYNRNDSRQSVLDRMAAAQVRILDEAWLYRDPEIPIATKEDALILASIVEKETGLADERPQVASVFVNRLRKGMKLQTDPTVVYGITEGKGSLGRGLRQSELRGETPYNTYVITGLPPTPIANPGKDAIEAVLNPAETDYLFFVADGTGGHAFAVTLPEHNANVRKWRAIEAERAAASENSESN